MIHIRNSEGYKHSVKTMPQYGLERAAGLDDSIPHDGALIPFRCYDDDGNLTHFGELTDDAECVNQIAALRYAETDEGATTIKVQRDGGEWQQEIA